MLGLYLYLHRTLYTPLSASVWGSHGGDYLCVHLDNEDHLHAPCTFLTDYVLLYKRVKEETYNNMYRNSVDNTSSVSPKE